MAQLVWRWAVCCTVRLRFPTRKRQLSLLHKVQNVSRIHQPPVKCVRIQFAERHKGRRLILTKRLHLLPKSRMVELYLHSPTRLHDVKEHVYLHRYNVTHNYFLTAHILAQPFQYWQTGRGVSAFLEVADNTAVKDSMWVRIPLTVQKGMCL
jgi:hypothetical protein